MQIKLGCLYLWISTSHHWRTTSEVTTAPSMNERKRMSILLCVVPPLVPFDGVGVDETVTSKFQNNKGKFL